MQIIVKGFNIGIYHEFCKTIQCERRTDKHLYRNLNAFQFNEEVFKLCPDWEKIEITTSEFILSIPRERFDLFKKNFNCHTRWKDEVQLAIPVAMFEKRDRNTGIVLSSPMTLPDFCQAIKNPPYIMWQSRTINTFLF